MTDILFDEVTHTYTDPDTGRKIPSVTTILRDVGLALHAFRADDVTEAAMDRGRRAHKAAELIDLGRLDRDTVSEDIEAYVSAYEMFLSESGFKPDMIEGLVYSRELGYAGRVDRTGGLGLMSVLDIKTGRPSPWAWLQTAAYARALWPSGEVSRFVLELKPSGVYTLHSAKQGSLDGDFDVFAAAARVYNWKKARKL